MKKYVKRIISVFISVLLAAACLSAGASALTPAEEKHLRFNSDGKFTVLNYSDFQDDIILNSVTKRFIKNTLEKVKPDLVVLTGDNIDGRGAKTEKAAKKAIDNYMSVFESFGVPVAIVFGNHDDDSTALSKEEQVEFYSSYSVSLMYDEGEDVSGVGNYIVPIYASDSSGKVKFNLYMFDDCASSHHLALDQIEWYKAQSDKLSSENGGPVPSIAFQHVIMPEIYDALKQTDKYRPGAVYWKGKPYVLPDNASEDSVLNEKPSPDNTDLGELQAFIEQKDVKAVVSGHDHGNAFDVEYKGVRFISTPTAGFRPSGNLRTRGARIIELDEDGTFETHRITMFDYIGANDPYFPLLVFESAFKQVIAFFDEMSWQLEQIIKK